MDRLANQSTLFYQAHCASPACQPSRTALLTGIQPYHSGVYGNRDRWRRALPDAVTIPQLFKQQGYQVLGAGKIYHSSIDFSSAQQEGWDEYHPPNHRVNAGPYPGAKYPLNGLADDPNFYKAFDWGAIPNSVEDLYDYNVASWVIEKLQTLPNQADDRPFFLGCGFFRPHIPWYQPQKYFEPFPLDDIKLPAIKADDLSDVPTSKEVDYHHKAILENEQYRQAVQAYLASIYFADEMLGRVLDAFDQSPYRDNTIIVLWSDNGGHLGEKFHWSKFTLWEESTRIPLMISVPPSIRNEEKRSAQVCNRTVGLIDVYPTLIDLCNLSSETDLNLDGRSLLPLLNDPAADWPYPVVTTMGANFSVRTEQLRLIRYSDGSTELYNHQIDPNEWTNLADEPAYAEHIAELSQWIPTDAVSRPS